MPKGLAKPDALLKAAGADWVTLESAGELRFKAAGEAGQCDVLPMYEVKDQKYSVYWQLASGTEQS